MKRFASLLLAAALALSLASCGLPELPPLPSVSGDQPAAGDQGAPVEEISLEVLLCSGSPEAEAWFLSSGTGFVDRFKAENPGVRLALTLAAPEDLPRIAEERLSSGNAPDILQIDGFSASVPDELLMSAEEFCPEELYRELSPALLDAAAEGGVRALPDLASVRTLYCSDALLKQAGVSVPGSWAELEEACRAILAHSGGEVLPLGLSMTGEESAALFACFAWSGGGGFVGADGGWALNSAENAAALEFVLRLVNEGLTNPNPAVDTDAELRELFAEGRLAMLLADERLPALASDAAVTAAPVPAGPGGTSAALASVRSVAVLRDDTAPDAAARTEAVKSFLRFYYADDNYAARAALEGLLPLTRSAAEKLAQSDPACGAWPAILESCRLLPADKPGWDKVCEGLYVVEQLSLIGGDVRAALDELQASAAGS